MQLYGLQWAASSCLAAHAQNANGTVLDPSPVDGRGRFISYVDRFKVTVIQSLQLGLFVDASDIDSIYCFGKWHCHLPVL